MEFTDNYLEAIKFYRTFSNKNLSITTGAADQPPTPDPDVTPNPTPLWNNILLNVSDLDGYPATNASAQILGIDSSIILGVNYTNGAFNNKIYYKISDNSMTPGTNFSGFTAIASSGTTFVAALNKYIAFGITGDGSGETDTVTIRNVSSSNTSLDTFTITDVLSGGGVQLLTQGLVLKFDANDSTSYPGTGNTWYNIASGYGVGSGGETYHFKFNGGNIEYNNTYASGKTAFVLNRSSSTSWFSISDLDGQASILNPEKADTLDNFKTIQLWYYPYDNTLTAPKGLLGKRYTNNGNTADGYNLSIAGWQTSGLSAQYQVQLNGDVNWGPRSTTFAGAIPGLGVCGPIGASAWQMVTLVIGFTANEGVRIYGNEGVTVQSFSYGAENEPVDGTTAAFVLGIYGVTGDNTAIGDYGKIAVGALYFYDKGLTVGDIINNYNATKSRYGY